MRSKKNKMRSTSGEKKKYLAAHYIKINKYFLKCAAPTDPRTLRRKNSTQLSGPANCCSAATIRGAFFFFDAKQSKKKISC